MRAQRKVIDHPEHKIFQIIHFSTFPLYCRRFACIINQYSLQYQQKDLFLTANIIMRRRCSLSEKQNLRSMCKGKQSQKQNHYNPSRSKIPYPILKHNPFQRQHSLCPQITKLRQNRSLSNIANILLNNESYDENFCGESMKEFNENLNMSVEENKKLMEILEENHRLMQELKEKEGILVQEEKKLSEIQKKYVRFLEVTNQKSEEHISMLMRSASRSYDKINLSKRKNNESLCEKASKLKSKLQNLDISGINPKDQTLSFAISQVIL